MARMRARDRRRQLLEVAADLFARYGYRGTTTARLAEHAGITEPILYRHFDNKQDLFFSEPLLQSDFKVELNYTNLTPDDEPVKMSSRIFAVDSIFGEDYTTDDGDSCTNIPWIQEVVVRYVSPEGPVVLNWVQK